MRNFAVFALAAGAAFQATAGLQAADPALLNLVMPDAKVLAGINVQKAKTTPFGQFLLTQLPVGDSLNGFVTATGFDPRQDLVEVLMASTGEAKGSGLVVARGTFSPAKIAAAVAADGKHVAAQYNGAELITSTNPADTGAVAFLSGQIAVVGDVTNVKAAIDRSGANNAIDPGLAATVAGYAATDAWSASINGGLLANQMGNDASNPLSGVFKTIQSASGSLLLTTPVQISVEALAASEQDATSLSDVVKFAVSMFQGNLPAGFSDTLNVTTDHSTVKVQISIPEDQLEQLIQTMKPVDQKAAKKVRAAHV